MCGIVGYLDSSSFGKEQAESLIGRMADQLQNRGPDDGGVWLDYNNGVAFGHRRLSILDLSSAGRQPMTSSSGRFVIVFNGEIYNHISLRKDLNQSSASPKWKGHSDTETILECIEKYGIVSTLSKLVGMFAFAIWDKKENTLTLVRDRLGEKPLYYGFQNGVFLFGSELKALKLHPSFVGEVDREALTLYLKYGYVPAPYSIYQGIRKLPPGNSASFCFKQGWREDTVRTNTKPYWSLVSIVEQSVNNPFEGNDDEAINITQNKLREAVRSQMVADVPIGAFLSGGVDSSLIVSLMQEQSDRAVKTFSIGFNDPKYDEAEYARAVAKHLGTDHTEMYVNSKEVQDVVPLLPDLYDEPFADSSQIPTYLVSKLAKQHVKVSLSGDGGDELFGGYGRYDSVSTEWRQISQIPAMLRKNLGRSLKVVPLDVWRTIFSLLSPAMPKRMRRLNIGNKVHNVGDIISIDDPMVFYQRHMSQWKHPESVVLAGREPDTLANLNELVREIGYTNSMMLFDTINYLPDDLLVKVDRAAMGVSLESRVPFLDYRVVEQSWRLPLSLKIRDGVGKWVLRKILKKYVPPELIERPKMGFSVPLESWLRGPLRDWGESLLDEGRLNSEGFFNAEHIRKKWTDHQAYRENNHIFLWSVLMFQSWLDSQKLQYHRQLVH